MRIRYDNKLWDVQLEDDGTMDTVISVCPVRGNFDREEFRYTLEGNERHTDGSLKITAFRILAKDAIEQYESDLV